MECNKCVHKAVCAIYFKNDDAKKCPHYANKNEFMRIKAFEQQGKRKTMGEIIREKRKARGWSLEKLADKVGITFQTLSRWERNEQTPRDFFAVCDLADIFECSLDELCGRTSK